MTNEREREEKGLPADQDFERDEELERVEDEDMETTHGDKLQNAVDKATKESPDSEQDRRTA